MSVPIMPATTKREAQFLVKLLMLGDSGVGKSCLMLRFSDGLFPLDIIGTAGIDCKEKTLEEKGVAVRLQIWDTAGQERYATITENYYKKATGIVLVYDVTDANSFLNVHKWMKSIKEKGNTNVEIILLGNKTDLTGERKVPREKAEELAKTYKIPFVETSAKAGTNVEKAFEAITRNVLSNETLAKLCALGGAGTRVSVSKEAGKGSCSSQ